MVSERANPNGDGVKRLMRALACSLAGLRYVFASEAAFRQELLVVLVLFPVGYAAGDSVSERVLLMGSLLLVLIVEILNSAIEVLVDRISTDIHPLSRHAKDLGSAAVFLTLVLAAITWLVILFG